MKVALVVTVLAVTISCAAARAQVEPVEIVGRAAQPAAATPAEQRAERSVPIALLAITAAALAAGSGAGWLAWRRWSRLDDTERAFLLLSLRLGVRHKGRQRVRAEARARGESPIGRLLGDPA